MSSNTTLFSVPVAVAAPSLEVAPQTQDDIDRDLHEWAAAPCPACGICTPGRNDILTGYDPVAAAEAMRGAWMMTH